MRKSSWVNFITWNKIPQFHFMCALTLKDRFFVVTNNYKQVLQTLFKFQKFNMDNKLLFTEDSLLTKTFRFLFLLLISSNSR